MYDPDSKYEYQLVEAGDFKMLLGAIIIMIVLLLALGEGLKAFASWHISNENEIRKHEFCSKTYIHSYCAEEVK